MRVWMASLVICVGGCLATAPPPEDIPPGRSPLVRPLIAAEGPRDAQPKVPLLVQVRVYTMTLPFGTVTRSDEFWKHIDEQQIDVGVQDLLIKNGLRAGVAPTADWDYFKKILDRQPGQSQPSVYQTNDAGRIELPLRPDVPEQTIFFFNRRDNLEGRSYDLSQNLLVMEYRPAPRKLGEVNLRLCPMIRTIRKRWVVVGEDDHRDVQYVSPEKFYELGFSIDLPMDKFLVFAPSPEAVWRLSLGHRFLVDDGPAGRTERVLLLVPQLYRTDDKPTPTSRPAAG